MLTEDQFSSVLRVIKEDIHDDLPTLINIELIEYEPKEGSYSEPGSPEMPDQPGEPGVDELNVEIKATIEGDLGDPINEIVLPLTDQNFNLYLANFKDDVLSDELQENIMAEVTSDYSNYDFYIADEPKIRVYQHDGKVRVDVVAFGSREKTENDYDQGYDGPDYDVMDYDGPY